MSLFIFVEFRMSFQLLCKQDEAHDDSIWSVAWCSNSLDGIEYILTGGADGVVKVNQTQHFLPTRSLLTLPTTKCV